MDIKDIPERPTLPHDPNHKPLEATFIANLSTPEDDPAKFYTAKMVRNPEATCGNCPFFLEKSIVDGYCFRNAAIVCSDAPRLYKSTWCGEHPDFWMQELPKETK